MSEPSKRPYSPFDRPEEGFDKVSEEDLLYLRGIPTPLHVTIEVTIEEGGEEE